MSVSGLRAGVGEIVSVHCTEANHIGSKCLWFSFSFSFVDTLMISSISLGCTTLLRIDANCFVPVFASFPLTLSFVRSSVVFHSWSSSTMQLQWDFLMLLSKCMLLGKAEDTLCMHAVSVQCTRAVSSTMSTC